MPETPKKHELKKDNYSRARKGNSNFLDLSCADCKAHVALYQKDGPGNLRRMYLDRIYAPEHLAKLVSQHTEHKGMPNLDCPECKKQLAIPMTYELEKRLAYRVHHGALARKKSDGTYPPVSTTTVEPTKLPDREEIHNVWDHDATFRDLKKTLVENFDPSKIAEIYETSNKLIQSEEPYQVKLGIHIGRLCIWNNSGIVQDWLLTVAPSLVNHSHPRVRHSALWNLRSAVWQDPGVASFVLEYGKAALLDSDPAVQRVAMWTLGDSVISDPELFEEANTAMQEYLIANPRESNFIFALEEFYSQQYKALRFNETYKKALISIRNQAIGMPGLRARCASILGEDFKITNEERDKSVDRLAKSSPQIKKLIEENKIAEVVNHLVFAFREAKTFVEKMKTIWIIRDALWSNPKIGIPAFKELSKDVADTSDGDIVRTLSVVLGDCVLQNPEELFELAIECVKKFFEKSDIDGSQIVMAQILYPLARGSEKIRSAVIQAVPELKKRAANKSVLFALDNLII